MRVRRHPYSAGKVRSSADRPASRHCRSRRRPGSPTARAPPRPARVTSRCSTTSRTAMPISSRRSSGTVGGFRGAIPPKEPRFTLTRVDSSQSGSRSPRGARTTFLRRISRRRGRRTGASSGAPRSSGRAKASDARSTFRRSPECDFAPKGRAPFVSPSPFPRRRPPTWAERASRAVTTTTASWSSWPIGGPITSCHGVAWNRAAGEPRLASIPRGS